MENPVENKMVTVLGIGGAGCRVLRGFVGAELYSDKESPVGHIGVWLRALTPYGRIYTEHEMLGKHVHGFVCR